MNDLYRDAAEDVSTGFSFDAGVLDEFLRKIYKEDFNPVEEIEPGMFAAVLGKINEATDKGFTPRAPVDHDYDFYQELKRNNEVFSAFKVHRMQGDMAALLLDEEGILKPFNRWLNDVQTIADHQVYSWLKTEYDTAIIRAHQAADWRQFEREKDILPNLEWQPSTSPDPGADHVIFWGVVRPVDDTFWNKHRPGDRWNCKCSLRATDKPETPENELPDPGPADKPADGLDGNPGKTGMIFGKTHPYIKNAREGAREAVEKFLEPGEYMIDGVKQIPVLDGKNRGLNEIVANTEADIRMNTRHETAVVIDSRGNVLVDKRGASYSVVFTDDECSLMKDAIVTHNHPRGWAVPERELGRIGNSFSMEDLILAISRDVAELRAVTPNYTFVMRRPVNGWGVFWKDLMEDYKRENKKLGKELGDRIARGTLTVSRANATHYHILAKRIAKKYDWEYVKARTR